MFVHSVSVSQHPVCRSVLVEEMIACCDAGRIGHRVLVREWFIGQIALISVSVMPTFDSVVPHAEFE